MRSAIICRSQGCDRIPICKFQFFLLSFSCSLHSLLIAFLATSELTSGIPTHALRAPHHNAHARAVTAGNNVKRASSFDDGDLLSALFPVSQNASKSWTTLASAPDARPLSDATLHPTRVMSELSHDYLSAPDGKLSMEAIYPEGSYALTHKLVGGISFYAYGPKDVDLTTAKEATFGYSVFFEDGFDFNLGGKLPGIYGGDSDDGSITCSGGRHATTCFSARLMWRTNGQGEMYAYLPPYTVPGFEANKAQCSVPPYSDCNPDYGASIGRGAFNFTPGQWTTVSERVRLNDAGEANGELELFAGGKSVIKVGGLILRDSEAGRMRGIQMQTFFGGGEPEWASPKDQKAYFSDFSVAITALL